jgi:hypothetical protein
MTPAEYAALPAIVRDNISYRASLSISVFRAFQNKWEILEGKLGALVLNFRGQFQDQAALQAAKTTARNARDYNVDLDSI